ncbi:hypothetical protein BVRB_2g034080 [Beta vulgaris subsp. vulgaris]|nr:hypothetical protein BVRB_2g034080 [Beta vulgaris subsp. vulgaris]
MVDDDNHHPYAPMNIDDHIMMDVPNVSVVPSNSNPVSRNNVWDLVDSWVIDPSEDHHNNNNNHQNQQEIGSVDVIKHGDVWSSSSNKRMRNGHDIEDQCHDHNEEEDDQLPLQVVWPSAPVPNSCSSCQVFREITHTNGTHTTKLEVHGEVGHVSHAVYKSNQGLDTSDFRIHHMLK